MFDEDDDEPPFPRKWLDKKMYVRSHEATGLPVLVRVNPHVTQFNEFVPDVVEVIVDDGPIMMMGRDEAEMYVLSTNCVPMEVFAKQKHGKVH